MEKRYPYNYASPPYRHKELYEWSDEYQAHKFFTDEDFKLEQKLHKLKNEGLRDYVKDAKDEQLDYAEYGNEFRYEDRYRSLKQDTVFAKNLFKIEDILDRSVSYSDFILKCLASGISERKANFTLLYYFITPARVFSYEYRNWTDEDFTQYSCNQHMIQGYARWQKFDTIRKEAFTGKKHNCGTYKEFIETEL